LICYSWDHQDFDVAFVVVVRSTTEIQYNEGVDLGGQRKKNLVVLSKQQLPKSKAGQFVPHSGIRFPQNVASAVATWDCASTTSNSSIQISSAKQEQVTLIGLTSLWTNGREAVSPEITNGGPSVLGKIDEILSWEKTKEQERECILSS